MNDSDMEGTSAGELLRSARLIQTAPPRPSNQGIFSEALIDPTVLVRMRLEIQVSSRPKIVAPF
jgi:hypothetical protein